ncbi:hypothetical protein [Flavobacterium denitrificans]|uniref:hypothetical protein n=1 Tax=Flavobacterium denitrificans TaxID=281361 RepID=UPI000420BC9F|nr:hypothetical protein [Flavobacterium denitrificans]
MKTTQFFIDKAESFLVELRSFELVPYNLDSITDDIYKDPLETDNRNYTIQSQDLKEIKFQMNLMFTEFDNGKLFEERLNNFTSADWFSNKPLLNHLILLNELFIDFLEEYRKE